MTQQQSGSRPPYDPQQVAAALPNDNRVPAGRMSGDTLELRLTVVPARWFVLGEENPAFNVVAFAEEGKAPSIPGPLVRVRAGTIVHVTLRNTVSDTIILRGLSEGGLPTDSVVIPPDSSTEMRFPANRIGTHMYWAVASGALRRLSPQLQAAPSRGLQRPGYDSQLAGAFIVDPPGAVPSDRVLVLTELADQDRCGRPCRERHGVPAREFTAINGRSWPLTERFELAVGDTVRWRLINAALQPHPMHLHGFYFRVDAHGSARTGLDSMYTPAQRRMAVTEAIGIGESVSIAWSPDRPGGWIFHCHLTPHAVKLPPVDQPDALDYPSTHDHGDADRHVLDGMNGLILGINVTGDAPAPPPPPARTLRLFIQSDSVVGDSIRRFGYVLQRGAEPRRDSLEYPGPVLVLTRGEPTRIEVVNRSPEPSAVHWHGIELESYYDGVAGLSGRTGRTAPAVRPDATFDVQFTPPRAGTFMYHTHFNEMRQQFGGLVGALIVLEPGERWDPTRDLVFLISDGVPGRVYINGSLTPPDIDLTVGTTYRLRFGDVSLFHPGASLTLVRDQAPVSWRPVAKDGFTLPESQATARPAVMRLASGETVDVEFTPDAPGDLVLQSRLGPIAQGAVLGTVRMRVRAP